MTYCCTICYEVIEQNNAAALLCGHIFDAQCIRTWIGSSSTCPVCRRPSSLSDLLSLYNEAEEDQIERLIEKEKGKLEKLHNDKISEIMKQVEQVRLEKQELMQKVQNHLKEYLFAERENNAFTIKFYQQKEQFEAQQEYLILTLTTLEELQKQLEHRGYISIKTIRQRFIKIFFAICLKTLSFISFKTTVTMCMNLSAGACLVLLIYEIFSITRVLLSAVLVVAIYCLYKQWV